MLVWRFRRLSGQLTVEFDTWHKIDSTYHGEQVLSVELQGFFGTNSAYVRKIVLKRSLINEWP